MLEMMLGKGRSVADQPWYVFHTRGDHEVRSFDGRLYADPTDATELAASDRVVLDTGGADNIVGLSSLSAELVALRRDAWIEVRRFDGVQLWEKEFYIVGSPCCCDGYVYVFGQLQYGDGYNVYQLDGDTGVILNSGVAPASFANLIAADTSGNIYTCSSGRNLRKAHIFNPGIDIWSVSLTGRATTLIVDEESGYIYCVEDLSGSPDIERVSLATGAVTGSGISVGTGRVAAVLPGVTDSYYACDSSNMYKRPIPAGSNLWSTANTEATFRRQRNVIAAPNGVLFAKTYYTSGAANPDRVVVEAYNPTTGALIRSGGVLSADDDDTYGYQMDTFIPGVQKARRVYI